MLDQLVESKEHSAENTRKSELVIGIAALAVLILVGLWTRDLFAHGFGVEGGDLELTTLVAPPPPADEPPPPKPEKQPEKQPDVDVRKELIQNIMQTPVKPPDVISTIKSNIPQMRENTLTKVGTTNSDTGADVGNRGGQVVDSGGLGGQSTSGGTAPTGGEEDAPPPRATPKPVPKIVSGGVLNG